MDDHALNIICGFSMGGWIKFCSCNIMNKISWMES
jgi:hypothetical protein